MCGEYDLPSTWTNEDNLGRSFGYVRSLGTAKRNPVGFESDEGSSIGGNPTAQEATTGAGGFMTVK